MPYYTDKQLSKIGFKKIGCNVKISKKASIYNPDQIEICDNSRIDDFCIISGRVVIGSFTHITPMCLVAGGESGIYFEGFCTLSYGVKVFSQSDDYSGATLTNSLIPRKYKKEIFEPILFERHVIVGAGSTIMPGVKLAEGSSIGAMALLTKSTLPWGIYAGIPARRIKDRKKDLLRLEQQFLRQQSNDSL